MKGRPHPSGRPIRRNTRPKHPIPIQRIPEKGPLTPRLKEEEKDLSLIGFHHVGLDELDDEYDDDTSP